MDKSQIQVLLESLFDSLDCMFNILSQGLDIAPAAQYRLEGQFQLLLSLDAFTWENYISRCEASLEQYGLDLPESSYWQWCFNKGDIYLRLPLVMQEAPVYR